MSPTSAPQIASLDHLVLTVHDLDAACQFYQDVLGMDVITFAGGRRALRFGNQKINLHQTGQEFDPKADVPTPGSADLCFLTDTPLDDVIAHLNRHRVNIIEGPVEKSGALGPILSVYFRDPDRNLIEVSNQL